MNSMICLKFLIILTFLSIIFNTCEAFYNKNPNKHNKVCTTKTCVIEAAKLLETIDESVSPCDDFYQFSCGTFIKNKKLPEHKSIVKQFSDLQDKLNEKVKDLVVNSHNETEKRDFVKNANNYYESCFNTTKLEELGDKPLKDLLQRLGGWPLIAKNEWSGIDWKDLFLRLRDYGQVSSMLFSLSISTDFKNNSRRILSIDQPSIGLGSRDMLLKGLSDPSVIAYKTLLTKTVLKLGANESEVKETIDELLRFETLLANKSMAKENRRNLTAIYDKKTVKELTQFAPNIHWLAILKKYVSDDITEEEEIVVFDTKYIQFLNSELPQLNNRLLVDYILWRVVLTELTTLDEAWYQIKEEFDKTLFGTKSRTPRWEMCLKNTMSSFSIGISHLYIKNFFSDEDKEKALEMFTNVVKQFKKSLNENDWMKNETLSHAMTKIDKMKLLVGYPDELKDESKVAAYYQTLWTNSSDYFGNNARIGKWYTDLAFGRLREAVNPFDWRDLSAVAIVNAYYHSLKNLVVMPAGILQGVFFNKDRPNYLNYGSIGYVSGHEIIHGFDDGGRQYDSSGNLRNWWDSTTDELYKAKALCIVNQYNNYTVNEVNEQLNGINTQGENIADNGGIIQAYKAYLSYMDNKGEEQSLPGLDYTPEQLFWISAGVQYCSKATKQHLKLQVMTDRHSPSRQRVNGVVANSQEFSKLFNCPLGSPMNPMNKCLIW